MNGNVGMSTGFLKIIIFLRCGWSRGDVIYSDKLISQEKSSIFGCSFPYTRDCSFFGGKCYKMYRKK